MYRTVVMDNRANPLYTRGGCGRVYRTSLGELTRPVIGQRAPAMRQAAARTVPPPATGSKPGFPARDGSNAMSAFFGWPISCRAIPCINPRSASGFNVLS